MHWLPEITVVFHFPTNLYSNNLIKGSAYWIHLNDSCETILGEDDRKISFGQLRRFSLRELQLATDNFSESNLIGQGGFGKVYRGVLSDNTKVAVKRLTDYNSPGGEAAFQREVQLISVAVHRNLLRLIGFCTTSSEKILVYPFMQNLSVAYRLRGISNHYAFIHFFFWFSLSPYNYRLD